MQVSGGARLSRKAAMYLKKKARWGSPTRAFRRRLMCFADDPVDPD